MARVIYSNPFAGACSATLARLMFAGYLHKNAGLQWRKPEKQNQPSP